MRFSIVTPVHVWSEERQNALQRTIKSVENQTFKDFEYIVINDGSAITPIVPDWVKITHKPHEERVIAYEEGFKQAKGEIICLLDSDDEYVPKYLETVDKYFREHPDYKLFNFGCIYKHADGTEATRGSFQPKRMEVGHEIFGGGNIVNGTFVFHSDIYRDLGGYPTGVIHDIDCSELNYGAEQPRDLIMWTPYDFSAYAQIEFPEIRQFFMIDHVAEPTKIIKELGNPWGNDFYLFYKYTRKYHSLPMEDNLYVVHPR